jgi:hypothetical protein
MGKTRTVYSNSRVRVGVERWWKQEVAKRFAIYFSLETVQRSDVSRRFGEVKGNVGSGQVQETPTWIRSSDVACEYKICLPAQG